MTKTRWGRHDIPDGRQADRSSCVWTTSQTLLGSPDCDKPAEPTESELVLAVQLVVTVNWLSARHRALRSKPTEAPNETPETDVKCFYFSVLQFWFESSRRLLRQSLHLKLQSARLGGGHNSAAFICAVAAGLWSFSWGSRCHCEGGGVIRGQQRAVQLWSLPPIVKRPEQREGESHGQDLCHTDGHAQETQRLQLLCPSYETVDLWTAALKQTERRRTNQTVRLQHMMQSLRSWSRQSTQSCTRSWSGDQSHALFIWLGRDI